MALNAFDRFTDPATTSTLARQQSTNSGRGILKYPLKDDDKYLGRLSFEVVNEDEHRVNLSEDFLNIFSNATTAAVSFLDELSGAEDGLNNFFANLGITSFKGTDKETIRPTATERNYKVDEAFGKIFLYLPQAINIQDAVAYDNNMQLGRIGAGVEASLLNGNDAATTASEFGKGLAESIGAISGGSVSPEMASVLVQNLARKSGFEGSANAVGLATQTALNPNTRTLFQSVPIRQFSFSFSLIATSPDEARVIQEIIKAFRTELYPEKIVAAGIDYAYRFPRRFIIKATYNDKEWPGIKFLPCYLQNFQTVYNPNSMGFHRDGQWSEVQITMSFSESRALARQDINDHDY